MAKDVVLLPTDLTSACSLQPSLLSPTNLADRLRAPRRSFQQRYDLLACRSYPTQEVQVAGTSYFSGKEQTRQSRLTTFFHVDTQSDLYSCTRTADSLESSSSCRCPSPSKQQEVGRYSLLQHHSSQACIQTTAGCQRRGSSAAVRSSRGVWRDWRHPDRAGHS